MKRLIRQLVPLCLAFLLGIFAKVVWDHRKQIDDVLSNLSFITRIDLVGTRARSTDVERGIAGLPGRTDATNTLALLAEGRSVETL